MKASLNVIISIILLCSSASAQAVVPPIHLHSDLLPGGHVQLSWESGPVGGLAEDFDDGLAQDFSWYTPDFGRYSVSDGHADLISDGDLWSWATAYYSQIGFTDFTCEMESVYIPNSTLSRGLMFRTNGHLDSDFSGYDFLLGLSYGMGRYSIGKYSSGGRSYITYWTESAAINIVPGSTNRLKVVASGATFELFINDVYVDSFIDSQYSSGYVGFIQAYNTDVQYNTISCTYGATLMDGSVVPEHGRVLDEWLDPAGNPTDQPPVMAKDAATEPTSRSEILHFVQDNTRIQDDYPGELDEFIEYRIYRNGQQIGTSTDPFYTDQLPSHGGYQYYVTAYYDPEGESIPCPTDTVKWGAVSYSIEGVDISVPAEGGSISYSAQLFNELPVAFTYVTFQTFIAEPPNFSTVHGPLLQRTFTLTPGQSINIPAMTQNIPAIADPGMYLFTAKLLYQGSPIREESFHVHKMTDDD